jgi:hypothetical protein
LQPVAGISQSAASKGKKVTNEKFKLLINNTDEFRSNEELFFKNKKNKNSNYNYNFLRVASKDL